jgi:hypothetical protein
MSTEQLIQKFCDTENVKYLARLPKEYQVMFQKSSAVTMKKKNTNKKIARIVLKYFNMNMDGTRKFAKVGKRELFRMSIGARTGDVLLGSHKGTKSATIVSVYCARLKYACCM